ncbi:MAG: phosphoribosylglycinamide formyltransferase [Candidatus Thermoplasmatota archaeon]|nr:phosphoribosylglycinamide formyltransferase [Candidatus Thermoplasmatota archaeon]
MNPSEVKKIKVAVLASGRGTDLQSIIDASLHGEIDADVKLVISDKQEAYALERARKNNIESLFLDPKGKTRDDYHDEISKAIDERGIDLIVLAGYMRILPVKFVKKYNGMLINIHPALLPSFPGTNAQKQAFDHGAKITGCTVHFVDEGCDTGPIILQAAVPVKDDDSPDMLADRILVKEHEILPRAVQLFAEGRLKIEGRKVRILPGPTKKHKGNDVLYSDGY